jgi:hypothetical protein
MASDPVGIRRRIDAGLDRHRHGALLRTIRLPAGAGDVGKVFAVAMHPDGELIAVGGLTRPRGGKVAEQIYLFDRANGTLVRRIEGKRQERYSPSGPRSK